MKRKTLLAIIIIFSFLRVFGQDTIWFNEIWQRTIKEKSFYYRLQFKDSIGYKVIDHYKNGVIQMTGHSLTDDSLFKVGEYSYYDEKGNLSSQGEYVKNQKTGTWDHYYANGQLFYTMNFNDEGKIAGNASYYYPDGQLKRSENYVKGFMLYGNCFTKAGLDTTYFPHEEMPEFKGGQQKMYTFIKDNLAYPAEASDRRIQGIVYVTFQIDKKGRVNDVKILKGVNISLNSAAVDVIKMMPKWKPGRIEGIPVSVQFTLPISFKLK